MIKSMTGFGKATADIYGKKVSIELKSLNSKQFDLSMRLSGAYREKEIDIRNEIAQRLERGKVDLVLNIDGVSRDGSSLINQTLVENYYEQIRQLAEKMSIPVPADWFSALLRLPDILKTDSQELSDDEWQQLQRLIVDACTRLDAFRTQEGATLQAVFEEKIANIKRLSTEISRYDTERVEHIKNRLRENLLSINDKVKFDPNRLEQELIFYIEKLDVNEEKVRLANHLEYFLETMNEKNAQGKKLGFIAQEIGREINTLGSKSNHSEMQKIVVLMKDELEQIKEQVLNVL
ncbi:MAG: YicC family protein [Prevotellaceae bacterium]|nr:YicC family protein [Prevotellaceae bacterium]